MLSTTSTPDKKIKASISNIKLPDKSENVIPIPKYLIPNEKEEDNGSRYQQLSSRSSLTLQEKSQNQSLIKSSGFGLARNNPNSMQKDSINLQLNLLSMIEGNNKRGGAGNKSIGSQQSIETTAIFQLEQALPQGGQQVSKISSVGFVEKNFIEKGTILKQIFDEAICCIYLLTNQKDEILKIQKQLKLNRDKYEDPLFTPDEYSLFNNIHNSPYISWEQNFIWKKIRDLFPKFKYQLFSTLSCQTMIRAGAVEIPYLVVAISILRDHPNRVMNLVENQVLHESALYYVRLCLDGVWKYITVDEYIPCVKRQKSTKLDPAFLEISPLTLQTHDVWPLLVLKAYAKYLGTYETLLNGTVEDALRDFTGAPIQKLGSEEENLSQIITSALDRKYIVLTERFQQLSEPTLSRLGARADVSYQISNILLLFGEVIVEIRDFFGTLRWRDESLFEKYKEEDLRALSIGQKPDSVYLRISDFVQCFEVITILKCNENYFYSSIPVRHAFGKYAVRKLSLKVPSLCHIELTQKDKRLSRNSKHEYLESRMLVLKKINMGQYELVDGLWSKHKNASIELELLEGEYYVVVIMEYGSAVVDTVLSYYGENQATWSFIDFKKEKDILENALKNSCFDDGEKKEVGDQINSYELAHDSIGLACFVFENVSALDGQTLQTPLLDPQEFLPFNQIPQSSFDLPPLSQQILLWKIQHSANSISQ